MGIGRLIVERHLWRVVVGYFFLAWFLLTAILLLQQASRFTDVLFGAQIPSFLIWELFAALLPNILAFTSPMALFTGIMIGLGQLQGDSELIALRAAGVSNLKILTPNLLLAVLLTIFTLYINFEGVPKSARLVRQIGVKAALAKLESPLEPGVFNNEIPKYVIYARDGNVEKGVWENVFIHAREKGDQVRLITAESGKIDSSNEQSELVLQNAVVTTLGNGKEIALEKVRSLRIAMEMGRRQILDKLQKSERATDEMGLAELAAFARQKNGRERLDAEILWHRRVSLAVAPIMFAFLGVAVSLRNARGGRGFNAILALLVLIAYYLASLFFEQLSRAGNLPPFVGSWIAPITAAGFSFALLAKNGNFLNFSFFGRIQFYELLRRVIPKKASKVSGGKLRPKTGQGTGFSGLLDRDVFADLLKYFIFSCGGLLFLYLIFTSFELWRFASTNSEGLSLLIRYLFYISPIVVFQVSPSALLLSVLFTYGVKSRRSEIVAWSAAGQNFTRLLIPAFVLCGLIGSGIWLLQESVLPQFNKRQDALRSQLRGGATLSQQGRFWFAAPNKIYSFVAEKNTRDEELIPLKEVEIYNFNENAVHLHQVVRAVGGVWENETFKLTDSLEIFWRNDKVEVKNQNEPTEFAVGESWNDLNPGNSKFLYESFGDLKGRIDATDSVSESRRLRVAAQKHFTAVFLPIAIVLFSSPFALTFGRRGNGKANLSLIYVFAIWLIFMGTSAVFEQFGYSGRIPEYIAAWAPLLMLTSIGTYFLSKSE